MTGSLPAMTVRDGRPRTDEFTRRPAPGARAPERLSELTDREIDVLRLVARGLSNADIARDLIIGAATVKTHVSNISPNSTSTTEFR